MEPASGGIFGVAIGVAALVGLGLLSVVVLAVFLTQSGKRKRAEAVKFAGNEGVESTLSPDTSLSAMPASSPAAPVQPSAPAAAKPDVVERIMLDADGAVFGAVPPFGSLRIEDDNLVFTAVSRIVSATGSGLFDGDGSSTMQSMGSMESGDYRYEIPLRDDGDTNCKLDDDAVVIVVGGKAHRFIPLGGGKATLHAFLRNAGFAF
jgi:hypothetical protein